MTMIDLVLREISAIGQTGIVGSFLLISMVLNLYLWTVYRAAVVKHEAEKAALFNRFISSRDKLIEKYYDFVRQSDRTLADVLRALHQSGDF